MQSRMQANALTDEDVETICGLANEVRMGLTSTEFNQDFDTMRQNVDTLDI